MRTKVLKRRPLSDARQEARRRRRSAKLKRARAALAARLHALEAQIERLSGFRPGHGSGLGSLTRRRNSSTLEAALQTLLEGREMGVSQAARALVDNGHRTASAHFRIMVNAALLNKKLFKRVRHGVYTLKTRPAAQAG